MLKKLFLVVLISFVTGASLFSCTGDENSTSSDVSSRATVSRDTSSVHSVSPSEPSSDSTLSEESMFDNASIGDNGSNTFVSDVQDIVSGVVSDFQK